MAVFCNFVAIGSLVPAIPRYVAQTIGGPEAVGFVVGAFGAAALLGRLLLTATTLPWSSRASVVGGSALLLMSSLILLVRPAAGLTVASRVLAGLGDALFLTAAFAAMYGLLAARDATRAVTHMTMTIYLGLIAGPLLQEPLYRSGGFQMVFAFSVAGSAAALAACAILPGRRTDETHTPQLRPDGTAERPSGRRQSAYAAALTLVISSGAAAFATVLPLQTAASGSDVAVEYAVVASTTLVLRLVASGRVGRLPVRALIVASAATTSAGLVVIAFGAGLARLAGCALLGTGQAFVFPILLDTAVRGSPAHRRTRVIALLTGAYDAAFILGPVLGGLIVAAKGVPTALIVMAGVVAVGACLTPALAPNIRPTVKET
ncbi:MFS transporter [Dactylosporangium roseum]|uniref:MFS transporter n=1 Tax=Dactylosporangium roseum TaxID=47989 RepID=A0ABY5Z3I8_9ACTN|nr:MFS transporter [Dactylosporangium roseum]UWZ36581.1 MFS transporter [Dactylosporangium roseum]